MQTIYSLYNSFNGKKNASSLEGENRYITFWLNALDAHDHGAKDHSFRVANVSLSFAKDLKVDSDQLPQIYGGALLHDIGKLFIPGKILSKPGPLSDEEWILMRQHPEYGYEFLSNVYFLRKYINIPYFHHERWNGGGYPCGQKRDEISLEARLFAIVDVWDSLSYDRCYNAAWPQDKINAYIAEQAGNLFDPDLVKRFLSNRARYNAQEEL